MGKLINKSRYFSFLILCVFFRGPAVQAMDLIEFLTVGLSSPNIQNNADSTVQSQPGFSVGGGVSLAFRLDEHWEIEATILYLPKKYSKSQGTQPPTDYNLATLQYPVVARYWLSEHFALGMGAYYSTGVGGLLLTQNSQPQGLGYNDILLTSSELGLTASAQYQLPLTVNINWVSQARILFGLSNLDQSQNGSLYTRDLQLLCGIGFKL